eukprot:4544711-Prymnesium_polylepis.2
MKEDAIKNVYSNLRKRYPGAHVHASTFDDFYDAAREPGVMAQLPVVTQEIGDTWLYGNPSDPLKNVHFREMSRLRSRCVGLGECDPNSVTMRRFDRLLTKIPEHTWGEDTTWYLGDNKNWTNAQLQAAIDQPNYRLTVSSWLEQRSYLPNAVRTLRASGESTYVTLASKMEAALDALRPSKPTAASLRADGFVLSVDPAQMFTCDGVRVGFGADASVTTLERGHAWASEQAPLGKYTYQSLSAQDFVDFDKDYGNGGCMPNSTDPGCHNFMKPNMIDAKPQHQEVAPSIEALWYKPAATQVNRGAAEPNACEFAAEAALPEAVNTEYGAPKSIWLRLAISTAAAASATAAPASFSASFDIQLFSKTPTRLAESSWVSFVPAVQDATRGWRLSPFNTASQVDPTDVVEHGATHLHSLGPDGFITYTGREGSLSLYPLDSPIVSMGLLSPFPTPGDNTSLPLRMAKGVHANIQNNIWNTNYPQWYPFVPSDSDSRFRFELRVVEARPSDRSARAPGGSDCGNCRGGVSGDNGGGKSESGRR